MKKQILIILGVIILVLVAWLAVRFIVGGPEDTWICVNGEWVKHGNPSAPKPTTLCGETKSNINTKKETAKSEQEYNWSTMDQGPYRDKISYATSKDLLDWTDSGKILAEHASVPGAVIKDNVIYVYFVDVSEDGKPEQLGLIRSTDQGKTWLDMIIITIQGADDKVPVDPAPFLLDDEKIRLYYFDINENRSAPSETETNKIYSAISTDGINFIQEDGVRFAKKDIFDPDVIKVGDTWRMYVGNVNTNTVISAVSKDGLNFNEEGIAYQGGAVPDIFYENNQYYLYTAGIDISTSSDGIQFKPTGKSFRSDLGMVSADPSVIKLKDGSYMMFYKTKEEKN